MVNTRRLVLLLFVVAKSGPMVSDWHEFTFIFPEENVKKVCKCTQVSYLYFVFGKCLHSSRWWCTVNFIDIQKGPFSFWFRTDCLLKVFRHSTFTMFILQFIIVKNLLQCNKNRVIHTIKQYFSLKYKFQYPLSRTSICIDSNQK